MGKGAHLPYIFGFLEINGRQIYPFYSFTPPSKHDSGVGMPALVAEGGGNVGHGGSVGHAGADRESGGAVGARGGSGVGCGDGEDQARLDAAAALRCQTSLLRQELRVGDRHRGRQARIWSDCSLTLQVTTHPSCM